MTQPLGNEFSPTTSIVQEGETNRVNPFHRALVGTLGASILLMGADSCEPAPEPTPDPVACVEAGKPVEVFVYGHSITTQAFISKPETDQAAEVVLTAAAPDNVRVEYADDGTSATGSVRPGWKLSDFASRVQSDVAATVADASKEPIFFVDGVYNEALNGWTPEDFAGYKSLADSSPDAHIVYARPGYNPDTIDPTFAAELDKADSDLAQLDAEHENVTSINWMEYVAAKPGVSFRDGYHLATADPTVTREQLLIAASENRIPETNPAALEVYQQMVADSIPPTCATGTTEVASAELEQQVAAIRTHIDSLRVAGDPERDGWLAEAEATAIYQVLAQ